MAKQRRASSRSGRVKPADASVTSDARVHQRNGGSTPNPPVSVPIPRTGHVEAVALYEEGVAALQAHEFARASALLRSVVSRYPEERELHERVRLYLNVCERHMAPRAASPSTPEERVFAATLGGERRKLRRSARPFADRQFGSARVRPCALHARVGARIARCPRRGGAASASRHRAESRQPHPGAPRSRPRAAARIRQRSSGARSDQSPQDRPSKATPPAVGSVFHLNSTAYDRMSALASGRFTVDGKLVGRCRTSTSSFWPPARGRA